MADASKPAAETSVVSTAQDSSPPAAKTSSASPARKDATTGETATTGSAGVVVRPDGRKVVAHPSEHLWQPRKRPETAPAADAGTTDDASPRHPKVSGCSPRIAALEVKPHIPLPPIQKSKKLSAAEQEKLTESMYEAARKRNEAARQKLQDRYMAIPQREITKSEEEINEVSYRMSVQETNVRRSRAEKLNEKYLARHSPRANRTTSAEGRAVLVSRLHDQSIKHQRDVTQELERLYTPRADAKRLTVDEQKQLADKLSSPRK